MVKTYRKMLHLPTSEQPFHTMQTMKGDFHLCRFQMNDAMQMAASALQSYAICVLRMLRWLLQVLRCNTQSCIKALEYIEQEIYGSLVQLKSMES